MNVWRLETIRLFRTLRWIGLLASFLVFGIGMPILIRYQDPLYRNLGGDVQVIVPPPTPQLGIAGYLQNASQIGLFVTILIAAGSLAFDAKPEWAAFLRTRSAWLAGLVVPKVAVISAVATASFTLGLVAAWIGSVVLIGSLPVASLLAGAAYGAVYLTFAVAVVAAAAGMARSAIGAGGLAIVLLILLPVAALIPALEPWSPSALVGSPAAIADGESPVAFLRAAGAAIAATAGLVWVSTRLLERREV